MHGLKKGKIEVGTISLPIMHFYVNIPVGISLGKKLVHACAMPIGNIDHKAIGCVVRDGHHSAAPISVFTAFLVEGQP